MASLPNPILTVLEQSQVSPPPSTVANRSLPLTFFDIFWLDSPPIHQLFFYEFQLTKTHFIESTIPNLKHSLSITLQHFFPFVGNLIVFPSSKKPEIRYQEGDFVAMSFAECNLDNFDDLTGNHPRDCGKFYHLIPLLGNVAKVSDYVKIPVFSIQVTLFPNRGISIGITNLHCLCDASTKFGFLKAWTSVAKFGTDELFLADHGGLPLYDRVVKNPNLDERYLKWVKAEDYFREEYRIQSLSAGPTHDKVRATFLLTRTVIDQLKKRVSTGLPTTLIIGYHISSFTVACGYIWSCIAKSRNNEAEVFSFMVDCRARMVPPIPTAYFGNCVTWCKTVAKTTVLTTGSDHEEGFVTAARLIGENLHKLLTDKDGIVKDVWSINSLFADEKQIIPMIGVAGTPKLKIYEMDFGWGNPVKYETISIDYNDSISVNASKESNEDLEIGVCLSATEMESFVRIFHDDLESYL